MIIRPAAIVCAFCQAAAVSLLTMPLHAAVIVVSTTSDRFGNDNRCTLREAVMSANTDTSVGDCQRGTGDDIIELHFTSPHMLQLAGADEDSNQSGDLDVRWNTVIRPADPNVIVEINAAGLDRVFNVFDAGKLTLERIRVTGGDVDGNGGGISIEHPLSEVVLIQSEIVNNAASGDGGGIYSQAMVTLDHSTVISNDATRGGGVFMSGPNALMLFDSSINSNDAAMEGGGAHVATIHAERSMFESNDAQSSGGGLFLQGSGKGGLLSQLVNTSVAENSSNAHGGGLFVDLGAELALRSSTIAFNGCDTDESGDGDGCGIHVAGGNVTMKNSIIAANDDFSFGGNLAPDCFGPLTSAGYNLVSARRGTDCPITGVATGNIFGSRNNPVDHQLDCPGSFGGPTKSVAPRDTSPALDAGDPAGCTDAGGENLETDQRGFSRVWDGPDNDSVARCDIGAVEIGGINFGDIAFFSDFEGDSVPQRAVARYVRKGDDGGGGGCNFE